MFAYQEARVYKDEVYDAIKTSIIIQEMRPGMRINEKELMAKYDIGKTPLREVFFRLQREGLIRRFPRSGTIVAPIDFAEIREAAEIRLALEGLVGELACNNITDDELEELRRHIDLLEEAARGGVRGEYVITESQLHALLYQATHNSKLVQTITEQQSLFARMWFSVLRTSRDLGNQVKDWRSLYKALRAKDREKVIRINKEHFSTFYKSFKTTF